MIMGELTEFADAATIATAIGTANLGDCIDLGAGVPVAGGDIEDLDLVVSMDTAATSAGSATVQFQLVTDSQAPPRVDGNQVVLATSGPIPVANLVAGYAAWIADLPETFNYKRYLGIQSVVATAALTAGKANAFLTPDAGLWTAVKAGI